MRPIEFQMYLYTIYVLHQWSTHIENKIVSTGQYNPSYLHMQSVSEKSV